VAPLPSQCANRDGQDASPSPPAGREGCHPLRPNGPRASESWTAFARIHSRIASSRVFLSRSRPCRRSDRRCSKSELTRGACALRLAAQCTDFGGYSVQMRPGVLALKPRIGLRFFEKPSRTSRNPWQCTNHGEIHKFTCFLHLHPQIHRTYCLIQLMASRASGVDRRNGWWNEADENREFTHQPSQRVKPEAKAAEGSLVAPEIAKTDDGRGCLRWQIRRMHEPVEMEYSSTAQPAMQGSIEARGASKAQPEVGPRGASRVHRDRQSRGAYSRCESEVARWFGRRAAASASWRLQQQTAQAEGCNGGG